MCGIHLLLNPLANGSIAIQKMIAAASHRGPDASGIAQVKDSVFLGSNRLKIQDLSNDSNQPFWSADEKAVLVLNGEIYNYPDLKNELLDLGHKFHTRSDTEVLLYWLMEYGIEKMGKIKGMFAFTFVDLNSGNVIIARDPSGEKPLYYWNVGDSWCFSSESKGILAASDQYPQIDTEQFLPYFYIRHSFPDKSLFQNIHQVLPGHGFQIPLDGKHPVQFKWDYLPRQPLTNNQSTFEKLLKDAVLKTFQAQRPVGLTLSGGADSSLLYAMWYEETGIPLHTYTVTFEKSLQTKYQDPVFAKKLIKKYPSIHHEVNISFNSLMENWEEYVTNMDQPIGDSAGFLTWMIAKKAKADLAVLVSGAGADELFGGYNRHMAFKSVLQYPKFYQYCRNHLSGFPLSNATKKTLLSLENSLDRTFINYASLLPIPKSSQTLFTKWYPQSPNDFKNALEWDRQIYLANDILKIHDNVCMAHGIEGRSPYLDSELIMMGRSLSERQHLELAGKKWIKEALENRGLHSISKRKKIGFGLPIQEWLRDNEEFKRWVYGSIRKMEKTWGKSFPEEMRKLSSHPENAKSSEFLLIWNLFLLASWLKHNIK